MATIPKDILDAVRKDDDGAFDALVVNEKCSFLVDHRAQEEEIVTDCEAVLKTGRLSAEFSGDQLFVVFGPKRIKVPLTLTPADRHIALLSLNEALDPEFEVRMLYASVGGRSRGSRAQGLGGASGRADKPKRKRCEDNDFEPRTSHALEAISCFPPCGLQD